MCLCIAPIIKPTAETDSAITVNSNAGVSYRSLEIAHRPVHNWSDQVNSTVDICIVECDIISALLPSIEKLHVSVPS